MAASVGKEVRQLLDKVSCVSDVVSTAKGSAGQVLPVAPAGILVLDVGAQIAAHVV